MIYTPAYISTGTKNKILVTCFFLINEMVELSESKINFAKLQNWSGNY
jgi:hypothetical protein